MNRVSDDDRSTLFSFLARGASQEYAPQSGEIIGILKQLMAAQKEEEDRKASTRSSASLIQLRMRRHCAEARFSLKDFQSQMVLPLEEAAAIQEVRAEPGCHNDPRLLLSARSHARLVRLTALTLQPACVLGVFFVKKENHLRLIVDCRKANALCVVWRRTVAHRSRLVWSCRRRGSWPWLGKARNCWQASSSSFQLFRTWRRVTGSELPSPQRMDKASPSFSRRPLLSRRLEARVLFRVVHVLCPGGPATEPCTFFDLRCSMYRQDQKRSSP